jgi:hypothetical protein
MANAPPAYNCQACRKQKKATKARVSTSKRKDCNELTENNVTKSSPRVHYGPVLKKVYVGTGQRRFIFKQEHRKGSSKSNTRYSQSRPVVAISRTSSDELTRRTNAFITVIEFSEVRYALSNYGEPLLQLPKHMGRNQSLDAAVNTMTISYQSYRCKQRPSEAISSYVKAIHALRYD